MKMLKRFTVLLVFALIIYSAAGGCKNPDRLGAPPPPPSGPGGPGQITPPPDQTGGDPSEPEIIGDIGQFSLPPGLTFGQIVGVAYGPNYIYILDKEALYAFSRGGSFVNSVAVPTPPAKSIKVLPETAPYPNSPIIAYSQGGGDPATGTVISIFAPNLDEFLTIEDDLELDIVKRVDLPKFANADPPFPVNITPAPGTRVCGIEEARFAIINPITLQGTGVHGLEILRDGSFVLKGDITACPVNPESAYWPNVILLFNAQTDPPYDLYLPQGNTVPATSIWDEPPPGAPDEYPLHWFHSTFQDQTSIGFSIAISGNFPTSRTDQQYFYGIDLNPVNFVDFVGKAPFTTVPPNPPEEPLYRYAWPKLDTTNDAGWPSVIGQFFGNLPGSFAPNPPLNPADGTLEDPDLTAGGPSGIGIDPRTDFVYICDPGNRRIQVFDKNNQFVKQIGDGIRGTSGNSFVAPSSVTIDLNGTIYVGDVDQVRIVRERGATTQFGDVAGIVYQYDPALDNPATPTIFEGRFPIADAVVSLSSSVGLAAITRSDTNGRYRFKNVALGKYFIVATRFNLSSDQTLISIVPGQTVVANFNLKPRVPGTIGDYNGYVIDQATNLPIEGVTVKLLGTGLSDDTDATGFYVIRDVLAGSYQAQFTHDNYLTITRDVYINAGQVTFEGIVSMIPRT